MPNTEKMLWPYPTQDTNPWFDVFESMVNAMEASAYAAREDRNLIFGGGGDVTWDAGSDTLTWAGEIVIYSMVAGFRLVINPGSLVVADGQVVYANVTRSPISNATLTAIAAGSVPNTNNGMAIAVRSGSTIYFRWGSKIENGETLNLFGVPGTGNASDVYERSATFEVPIGASSEEATLGRIAVVGSLIGLSAELTMPVTAGTITINAKVNGVTKLTVQLSTVDATVKQTVVSPSTYPILSADQITVEVIGVGYANVGSLPAGLTVNVILSAGLALPLGGVPDAAVATKGVTRLSVAPVSSTIPIAVGDNDPRLTDSRRIVYTVAQPGDGTAFVVPISPVMPSTSYIVISSLGTVVSHVTMNIPTAGRLVGQFSVETSAALANGDTLYFHVVGI